MLAKSGFVYTHLRWECIYELDIWVAIKRVGVGKLDKVKPRIGSGVFGENSHKLEILLISTLDLTNHLSQNVDIVKFLCYPVQYIV